MKNQTILLFIFLFCLIETGYPKNGVIYGDDSRRDLYMEDNPLYLDKAKSVAAMIKPEFLVEYGERYKIIGETLRERGICKGERFANQIQPAVCTGFLIGEDILVTAGHCIEDKQDCSDYKWVFDYKMASKDSEIYVKANAVYGCKKIIVRSFESYSNDPDYAVIRLDRKVVGRTPLKYRKSGRIRSFSKVFVIGYPDGLPLKIADDASVRFGLSSKTFLTNLDTFAGNSGSPVFSESGMVEGILIGGHADYEKTLAGCLKPVRCSNLRCSGEEVTRIKTVPYLNN